MNDLKAATDAQLLELSSMDPAAFTQLYRRYVLRVLAYFQRRTRDPEVSADLTAEVFAAVLEAAGSFDVERAGTESAEPWLFAIARNTLARSLRHGRVEEEARRKLGMSAPLVLDDPDLEKVESLALESPALESLDGLPAEQRRAIVERVIHERDYSDIAAELQCSSLTVRKRVSRGLSRLRSQVKESQ